MVHIGQAVVHIFYKDTTLAGVKTTKGVFQHDKRASNGTTGVSPSVSYRRREAAIRKGGVRGMRTVWRPALRCDSSFKNYIDSLNQVTSLDKNQIMRLMIFIAAHSGEFKQIIAEYKKADVTKMPGPEWEIWEDGYWLKQTYPSKKNDVILKSLETKEVSIKKGEDGVIKIDLRSLLSSL